MYKFRISKSLPFWAKNNDNKPSLEILNKWKQDNLVEATNITVNFLDFQNVIINTEFNGIKYIEIKNTIDENDTRYYYVNTIDAVGSNNTYRFRGIIDIYASYTVNFINDNLDTELVFLRKHEYDKKALQIEDTSIQALPKFYKNFYFKKVLFNKDENKNVWYGNKTGLSGDDLVNANKYYVFKDGPNGGYKFFPIFSKTLDAILYYEEQVKGNKEFYGEWWNGRSNGNLRQEIPDNVNQAVVNAYEQNKIIQFYYKKVNYGYRFPAHTVWLSRWNKIENVPYGTLPIDISAYNTSGNNAGAGLKYIDYNIIMLGNTIYHAKYTNITVSKHGDIDYVRDNGRMFAVDIFENNPVQRTKKVKNSITGLEEYRRKEENINKFLGIFYLPHFFNFSKFDFEGDYVYVTINPTGDNIGLFNIFDYNMSSITDKLNNSTYSTPYFLKYLNIKYFGNTINAEFRVNDMNKIFIGGKIFFTDTCNIISKSDELISLDKSVISFPYQLPIGVDTYEQYVKANRNVTDTGFAIERQKQDLAIAQSLFGGTVGAIGSAAKAVGKGMSGDIAGAASAAADTVGAIGGTAFGIVGQIQGMQQMEQKIRAQYQQANMTMGNNIQFSNIANAALTEYYDSNDEQYEGVEISDLDENSLVQLNNYIFFNGYLNPEKDTLSNRLNKNRKFNFIQIDAQLLMTIINIHYNENRLNNEIYSMIIDQLTNGIRIWNEDIEKVDLPVYDDNEEWPDQPSDTRPPITPEQPPIDTSYIVNIEYGPSPTLIELGACTACWGFAFFMIYFNNKDPNNYSNNFSLLDYKTANYEDLVLLHLTDDIKEHKNEPKRLILNIDMTNIKMKEPYNWDRAYHRLFRWGDREIGDITLIKSVDITLTNCSIPELSTTNWIDYLASENFNNIPFKLTVNGSVIFDGIWVNKGNKKKYRKMGLCEYDGTKQDR